MKALISLLVIILGSAGAYSYSMHQQSRVRTQQLVNYEQHVQQLLTQVEDNSLKRLEQSRQITKLESDATMLNSQLTSVANRLRVAQQQTDPDYGRIEREIRRQINRELELEAQQSPRSARTTLVKSLAALDPVELGEIMSLQGQFGGFLQALDVSDERMEVVVTALSNLIADQNQQRMNMMMEARSQDANRREIRSALGAITSPEAQLEALAFDLTAEELAVLEEFQATRTDRQGLTRSFMANPSGAGNGVPMYIGELRRQRGAGTAPALPLPSGNR